MSDIIKLDFEKIEQAGNDIKQSSKEMFNILKEVNNVMTNSKSVYDSKSGEEVRTSFKKNSAEFDEFKEKMDKYGEFLVQEAERRKKSDKNAEENVPQL